MPNDELKNKTMQIEEPQEELDMGLTGMLLQKLGDIEELLSMQLQKRHSIAESDMQDTGLTHELLARLVKGIESIEKNKNTISDTKTLTLVGEKGADADPIEIAQLLQDSEDFLAKLKADPYDIASLLKEDSAFVQLIKGERGDDGNPGNPGAKGEDGKTPKKGEDYFTESDKKEFVAILEKSLDQKIPKKVKDAIKEAVKDIPTKSGLVEAVVEQLSKGEKSIKADDIDGLAAFVEKKVDAVYDAVSQYVGSKSKHQHGGGTDFLLTNADDIDFTTLADGYALKYNAAKKSFYFGPASGGGGGSPAGSNLAIQINNGGSFGGSATLLTLAGTIQLASGQSIDSQDGNQLLYSKLSDNNFSFGNAGNKTLTGTYNVLAGTLVGQSLTNGFSNTFFGSQIANSASSANQNTGFGMTTLNSLTTGADNAAFGRNALRSITTQSNSFGLGNYAGANATGSNEFYLDNLSRASNSAEQQIGLMYGTFAATAAAQTFRLNAKTGIGASSGNAWLTLAATATTGASLNIPSGTAPTSPNNGDIWQASNHLYIRIAGVTYQLDQQAGGGSQTPWASDIDAAGFTLYGNSTSGGNLALSSTSHATKGSILFGTAASYDEVNNRFIIGTATGVGRINLPDAGTAVADGITWGNNDTAIFRSAANTLRVQGAATTRYLDILIGSTTATITAKGSAGDTLALRGGTSSNNATLSLGGANNLGTLARNIADANTVFTVTQSHASATGDIQDWANSGGIVASILQNGQLSLTPTSLGGSLATSALDIAQTWNTTGSPTAIKLNITNTASGAAANLMDLQVGGVSQFRVTKAGDIFGTSLSASQIYNADNNITAASNAATVTRAYRNNVVTNNSAAGLTITLSTAGATAGDMLLVQILDFSAVAQTITWVNTENSLAIAPTTSNGSTTLPRSAGFKWNPLTSKWRCMADS